MSNQSVALPLKLRTPDSWGISALKDPLTLLNDHAHLERKAATNALELLGRWPEGINHKRWVRAMTAIAKDEINHFAQVVKILESKGQLISKGHKSAYAQGLRSFVRLGSGKLELVDRLLVSSLIELRSCERFEILSRVCEELELSKLYKSLWASERTHFKIFLNAASEVLPKKEIEARWEEALDAEARLLSQQLPGSRIHSGWE